MPSDPGSPARRRPIIRRKLERPTLPDRFAGRPRVREFLADLLERKRVVVLSATAGAGKTTALVEALGDSEAPVAWLTVDHTDASPGRLVTYVEAALAQVLPDIEGAVMSALSAGIPHPEAAGLLAQSVEDRAVTFVLDDLERLGNAEPAWAVVDALVRYAPPGMVLVLVSRRMIPPTLCKLEAPDIALVGDAVLAFTAVEAADALTRSGRADVDPAQVVKETDGWVTGVLFDPWQRDSPIAGFGGEADPLHGYLASETLGQLDEVDADFLVATSLLPEITVRAARALGRGDADERLRSLRAVHLPATWTADGRALRCHSLLREYLLSLLERRGDARELHLAFAHWLRDEHHDEQAVDEFLKAGKGDEAAQAAERCIIDVVERLDISLAERWISALDRPHDVSPLTTAELMIAISGDDAIRAVEICESLAAREIREALAASDERARWLMVWAYLHVADWDNIAELARCARPEEQEAMRFVMSALRDVGDGRPPDPPAPGSVHLRPMMQVALWCRGRSSEIIAGEAPGWMSAMELPWHVAALRALGRTEAALEAFDRARSNGIAHPTMSTFVVPELLMDAGRIEDAAAVIHEAREVAGHSGSLAYQMGAALMEARYALRVSKDPIGALAALGRDECARGAAGYAFLAEYADTVRGHALLMVGRDDEARDVLARAVGGMRRGDRNLNLAAAAVYLAEAEGRLGNEEAADLAASLAVDAATRQRSDHLLLQALAEFPTVLTRALEDQIDPDSKWHELARALANQGGPFIRATGANVALEEFGLRRLTVAGAEAKPRIAKSYELLAFLTSVGPRGGDREELLHHLFGDRRDESTRAYLRQAVHWLRKILPEGLIVTEAGRTRLSDIDAVSLDSQRFQQQLATAARLQGAERLDATLSSLSLYDAGEYLPGAKGPWAIERGEELGARAVDARSQAAALALAAGRHDTARSLVDEVLQVDPFREGAWRLAMRIAHAVGDEPGVLANYKRCEAALAELDASPSPSTERLLTQLRL